MRVGDLVLWKGRYSPKVVGLVIATGKYAGNTDVKVLWSKGLDSDEPHTHNSKFLTVLTSS